MDLFTYSSLKTKLLNDLDIEDLDFIDGEEELLGYINEAIDDAESVVHTLGLDAYYFNTQSTITLVSGTSDYSLPTDIFATKIRKMFYINGATKYEIFRVRDLDETPYFEAGDDYKYLIVTTTGTANNWRIRLYPTPAESGAYITIWYIRNATRMTTSTAATNICEIPDCNNFVLAHVKMRVLEKMGNPLLTHAIGILQAQRDLMTNTLMEMVPDENTMVEPDVSFYEDSTIVGNRLSFRG